MPAFRSPRRPTCPRISARLGVGACYTSPYFDGHARAAPTATTSAITTRSTPSLAGARHTSNSTARLTALGLGHIVDFVPNHMGIGTGVNAWWRDVLENGPGRRGGDSSTSIGRRSKPRCMRSCCCRSSANQYGRVLERGELSLKFHDGLLVLVYADHELPINPKHVPTVLRRATGPLTELLGADSPQLHEFLSILTSLQNLPESSGYEVERCDRASA